MSCKTDIVKIYSVQPDGDTYVISGFLSGSTLTLQRNDGGNISIYGFTTGMTDSYTADSYLSGTSIVFDNNILGSNYYNVDLLPLLSGKTDLSLFIQHTGNTSIHHTLSELDGRYVNKSGDTINGDLIVNGDSVFNTISGSSISINGGEIMTRIPDSQDFQLFGNQSSTGIIKDGGLSVNTIDNSKFDLGVVQGWIVDNTTDPSQPVVQYIDYSGSTIDNPSGITLSYLATNPVTYIGITGETTTDIVQSTSPFTESDHRDTLILGVVIHSNNTFINAINDLPALAIDPTAQYYDLIRSIGFFNLESGGVAGNIYGPNDGNLKMNKSFGRIFAHSANYVNDPKNPHIKDMTSGASITFRYRLQDSTEYSNTTDIDPNNYDNNGVLTAVPQNKFTVQRITLFTSNITRLQYGQNIYDSLDDAEATLSSEDFVPETNIADNGLLRGFIITKQGTTSLGDVFTSKFISAADNGHANDTVVGNVHRTEIINHASTGLREGGLLAADSSTTFIINSGSGIVVDNTTNPNTPTFTEVVWDNITGNTITALSSDVVTFIGIDDLGVVNQFPLSSPPSQSDKRLVILLGAIAHSNKTSITNIYNGPTHITSPINQHEDLTSSIGTFSVKGNHIAGVVGSLELTKTLGSSYFYGGNFQTDPSSPSTIITNLISGSTTPTYPLVYASGTDVLGLFGYTIDPNNYDPNGLGVLTPVSVNKYVPHRIWHLPINNLLVFQYGQTEYNSLNLAIDGFSTEDYIEPPGLDIGAYLISVVITKEGETDLSNTSTTKFIQQGKFAGTGGGGGSIADSLQTAYNNSIQPEIVTDPTRGSVDLRVGSGSDSDNLMTFQSSGGTINAWINGVGDSSFNNITSTTISGGTFYGDGSNLTGVSGEDNYVSGATMSGDTLWLTRTGGLSNVTVDLSQFNGGSSGDTYVINGFLSGDTLTLGRNDGGNISVSGFTNIPTSDNYTTGATLSGNILSFDRTDSSPAYSVDLSSITTSGTSSSIIFSNTSPSPSIYSGTTWVRTTDYEYFLYDTIRGKWLSTNTNQFEGARNKNNQTDVFLRTVDGTPYNLAPYYVPKNSTIVSVVGETSVSNTFKILLSTGTTLPSDIITELPISSSLYGVDNTINVDVLGEAPLYLYMSGNTVDRPKATIYYKYR